MPTPNEQPSAGAGRPVRYYPRRIRRPAPPQPLTPSQALHLARDASRAERAARTAGHHEFIAPEPAAQPSPPPGLLRRLVHRVLGRSSSRSR